MFKVFLYSICMIKVLPNHTTFLAVRTYCREKYNNNQEYAELKNQNNSFKFISWFQDWKKEKRWVTDLQRETNVDKDGEYKTKDQS